LLDRARAVRVAVPRELPELRCGELARDVVRLLSRGADARLVSRVLDRAVSRGTAERVVSRVTAGDVGCGCDCVRTGLDTLRLPPLE
jgi:hypothetical protein